MTDPTANNLPAPSPADKEPETTQYRRPGPGPIFLGLFLFVVGQTIPVLFVSVRVLGESLENLANGGAAAEQQLIDDITAALTGPVLTASLVLSWIGLLTPIFIASRSHGRNWREVLRWKFKPSRDIPIALGIAVAYRLIEWGVLVLLTGPLGVNENELGNTDFLESSTGVWLVVLIAAAVVGAPIVEEIFFRGYFLTVAQARFGAVGAVTMTSLVFGLLHAQGTLIGSLFAIAATGFIGAVLAVLVLRTGRLGAAITTHIVFNASGVAAALLLAS